jgi:hypothetical protein
LWRPGAVQNVSLGGIRAAPYTPVSIASTIDMPPEPLSTVFPQPAEPKLLGNHEVFDPAFRFDVVVDTEDGPGGNLYVEAFLPAKTDPNKWESAPRAEWPLIASVTSDRVRMYPIHANPHAKRYLAPKHPQFRSIVYHDGGGHVLPISAKDVLGHIASRLPWGLFNEAREGYGLAKELTEVPRVTRQFVGGTVLVVAKEGESRLNGDEVVVSESDMDSLRRSMNRIDRRKREGVRHAKWAVVLNDLVTKLDPVHLKRSDDGRFRPIPTGSPARTRHATALRRQAGEAAVAQVRASLPVLASERPYALMELRAEIERVTLTEMIAKYEELLSQELPEPRWQAFFEAHTFVLGLVFAHPVHLLKTQFHAQGTSIDGSGAQIGDFLLRHTGRGLAIVEIKKPGTELLSGMPYRNTQVFAPSRELSGAVTQTLFQQSALRSNWLVHQTHKDLRDSSPDAIKCVVVAGRLPTDAYQLRSFDIFRNACKDVEILTYDELLAKLQHIRDHLNAPLSRMAPVSSSTPPRADQDLF